MKLLTFTTLYPHAARQGHGIFVETRLRHLLAGGRAEARVIAPVPWFPFGHARFGEYALHARAPVSEARNGIEVLHPRYLSLPKIGMTLAPLLLYRAMLPVVERLLPSYPFDLIDAHYFYPDGVAAVMLGLRLGKPVVVTARGTDVNLIAQYPLPRRMIRWAASRAAGVVAVSKALKERLAEIGAPEEKLSVLRNGVDLKLFAPLERSGLRQRLGMKRKTLLSVGNLIGLKGHDLAIRALLHLPEHHLVVIGSGPGRSALQTLARELGLAGRVRVVGAMDQMQLREYYAAADALVLASSREGWPNVLLEAMACGTPVVACAVGGTPEIVTCAEAGLLVEERSAIALARAVNRLFSSYPDREATRRHAEKFSWDATTAGQLQLFERILARSAKANPHVRHLRTPAL